MDNLRCRPRHRSNHLKRSNCMSSKEDDCPCFSDKEVRNNCKSCKTCNPEPPVKIDKPSATGRYQNYLSCKRKRRLSPEGQQKRGTCIPTITNHKPAPVEPPLVQLEGEQRLAGAEVSAVGEVPCESNSGSRDCTYDCFTWDDVSKKYASVSQQYAVAAQKSNELLSLASANVRQRWKDSGCCSRPVSPIGNGFSISNRCLQSPTFLRNENLTNCIYPKFTRVKLSAEALEKPPEQIEAVEAGKGSTRNIRVSLMHTQSPQSPESVSLALLHDGLPDVEPEPENIEMSSKLMPLPPQQEEVVSVKLLPVGDSPMAKVQRQCHTGLCISHVMLKTLGNEACIWLEMAHRFALFSFGVVNQRAHRYGKVAAKAAVSSYKGLKKGCKEYLHSRAPVVHHAKGVTLGFIKRTGELCIVNMKAPNMACISCFSVDEDSTDEYELEDQQKIMPQHSNRPSLYDADVSWKRSLRIYSDWPVEETKIMKNAHMNDLCCVEQPVDTNRITFREDNTRKEHSSQLSIFEGYNEQDLDPCSPSRDSKDCHSWAKWPESMPSSVPVHSSYENFLRCKRRLLPSPARARSQSAGRVQGLGALVWPPPEEIRSFADPLKQRLRTEGLAMRPYVKRIDPLQSRLPDEEEGIWRSSLRAYRQGKRAEARSEDVLLVSRKATTNKDSDDSRALHSVNHTQEKVIAESLTGSNSLTRDSKSSECQDNPPSPQFKKHLQKNRVKCRHIQYKLPQVFGGRTIFLDPSHKLISYQEKDHVGGENNESHSNSQSHDVNVDVRNVKTQVCEKLVPENGNPSQTADLGLTLSNPIQKPESDPEAPPDLSRLSQETRATQFDNMSTEKVILSTPPITLRTSGKSAETSLRANRHRKGVRSVLHSRVVKADGSKRRLEVAKRQHPSDYSQIGSPAEFGQRRKSLKNKPFGRPQLRPLKDNHITFSTSANKSKEESGESSWDSPWRKLTPHFSRLSHLQMLRQPFDVNERLPTSPLVDRHLRCIPSSPPSGYKPSQHPSDLSRKSSYTSKSMEYYLNKRRRAVDSKKDHQRTNSVPSQHDREKRRRYSPVGEGVAKWSSILQYSIQDLKKWSVDAKEAFGSFHRARASGSNMRPSRRLSMFRNGLHVLAKRFPMQGIQRRTPPKSLSRRPSSRYKSGISTLKEVPAASTKALSKMKKIATGEVSPRKITDRPLSMSKSSPRLPELPTEAGNLPTREKVAQVKIFLSKKEMQRAIQGRSPPPSQGLGNSSQTKSNTRRELGSLKIDSRGQFRHMEMAAQRAGRLEEYSLDLASAGKKKTKIGHKSESDRNSRPSARGASSRSTFSMLVEPASASLSTQRSILTPLTSRSTPFSERGRSPSIVKSLPISKVTNSRSFLKTETSTSTSESSSPRQKRAPLPPEKDGKMAHAAKRQWKGGHGLLQIAPERPVMKINIDSPEGSVSSQDAIASKREITSEGWSSNSSSPDLGMSPRAKQVENRRDVGHRLQFSEQENESWAAAQKSDESIGGITLVKLSPAQDLASSYPDLVAHAAASRNSDAGSPEPTRFGFSPQVDGHLMNTNHQRRMEAEGEEKEEPPFIHAIEGDDGVESSKLIKGTELRDEYSQAPNDSLTFVEDFDSLSEKGHPPAPTSSAVQAERGETHVIQTQRDQNPVDTTDEVYSVHLVQASRTTEQLGLSPEDMGGHISSNSRDIDGIESLGTGHNGLTKLPHEYRDHLSSEIEGQEPREAEIFQQQVSVPNELASTPAVHDDFHGLELTTILAGDGDVHDHQHLQSLQQDGTGPATIRLEVPSQYTPVGHVGQLGQYGQSDELPSGDEQSPPASSHLLKGRMQTVGRLELEVDTLSETLPLHVKHAKLHKSGDLTAHEGVPKDNQRIGSSDGGKHEIIDQSAFDEKDSLAQSKRLQEVYQTLGQEILQLLTRSSTTKDQSMDHASSGAPHLPEEENLSHLLVQLAQKLNIIIPVSPSNRQIGDHEPHQERNLVTQKNISEVYSTTEIEDDRKGRNETTFDNETSAPFGTTETPERSQASTNTSLEASPTPLQESFANHLLNLTSVIQGKTLEQINFPADVSKNIRQIVLTLTQNEPFTLQQRHDMPKKKFPPDSSLSPPEGPRSWEDEIRYLRNIREQLQMLNQRDHKDRDAAIIFESGQQAPDRSRSAETDKELASLIPQIEQPEPSTTVSAQNEDAESLSSSHDDPLLQLTGNPPAKKIQLGDELSSIASPLLENISAMIEELHSLDHLPPSLEKGGTTLDLNSRTPVAIPPDDEFSSSSTSPAVEDGVRTLHQLAQEFSSLQHIGTSRDDKVGKFELGQELPGSQLNSKMILEQVSQAPLQNDKAETDGRYSSQQTDESILVSPQQQPLHEEDPPKEENYLSPNQLFHPIDSPILQGIPLSEERLQPNPLTAYLGHPEVPEAVNLSSPKIHSQAVSDEEGHLRPSDHSATKYEATEDEPLVLSKTLQSQDESHDSSRFIENISSVTNEENRAPVSYTIENNFSKLKFLEKLAVWESRSGSTRHDHKGSLPKKARDDMDMTAKGSLSQEVPSVSFQMMGLDLAPSPTRSDSSVTVVNEIYRQIAMKPVQDQREKPQFSLSQANREAGLLVETVNAQQLSTQPLAVSEEKVKESNMVSSDAGLVENQGTNLRSDEYQTQVTRDEFSQLPISRKVATWESRSEPGNVDSHTSSLMKESTNKDAKSRTAASNSAQLHTKSSDRFHSVQDLKEDLERASASEKKPYIRSSIIERDRPEKLEFSEKISAWELLSSIDDSPKKRSNRDQPALVWETKQAPSYESNDESTSESTSKEMPKSLDISTVEMVSEVQNQVIHTSEIQRRVHYSELPPEITEFKDTHLNVGDAIAVIEGLVNLEQRALRGPELGISEMGDIGESSGTVSTPDESGKPDMDSSPGDTPPADGDEENVKRFTTLKSSVSQETSTTISNIDYAEMISARESNFSEMQESGLSDGTSETGTRTPDSQASSSASPRSRSKSFFTRPLLRASLKPKELEEALSAQVRGQLDSRKQRRRSTRGTYEQGPGLASSIEGSEASTPGGVESLEGVGNLPPVRTRGRSLLSRPMLKKSLIIDPSETDDSDTGSGLRSPPSIVELIRLGLAGSLESLVKSEGSSTPGSPASQASSDSSFSPRIARKKSSIILPSLKRSLTISPETGPPSPPKTRPRRPTTRNIDEQRAGLLAGTSDLPRGEFQDSQSPSDSDTERPRSKSRAKSILTRPALRPDLRKEGESERDSQSPGSVSPRQVAARSIVSGQEFGLLGTLDDRVDFSQSGEASTSKGNSPDLSESQSPSRLRTSSVLHRPSLRPSEQRAQAESDSDYGRRRRSSTREIDGQTVGLASSTGEESGMSSPWGSEASSGADSARSRSKSVLIRPALKPSIQDPRPAETNPARQSWLSSGGDDSDEKLQLATGDDPAATVSGLVRRFEGLRSTLDPQITSSRESVIQVPVGASSPPTRSRTRPSAIRPILKKSLVGEASHESQDFAAELDMKRAFGGELPPSQPIFEHTRTPPLEPPSPGNESRPPGRSRSWTAEGRAETGTSAFDSTMSSGGSHDGQFEPWTGSSAAEDDTFQRFAQFDQSETVVVQQEKAASSSMTAQENSFADQSIPTGQEQGDESDRGGKSGASGQDGDDHWYMKVLGT